MSGIAGMYHTDGRPVDSQNIGRMVDAQAHRGPDGMNVWRDEEVALGHLMMHTTPEAVYEEQPMKSRDGQLVLTADARIDNRDELISRLQLVRPKDRPITDAELILLAYERWGTDCPEHLLGAFAFAIWDAREEHLFCARDHVGLRPFYYCVSEQSFLFGTEINGLLAHPDVSDRVNEVRIADFLARIHLSKEYTFYEDIVRLPPGHCAVVNPHGFQKRAYWEVTLPPVLELDSEEEYAEAFREVFAKAVNCRLRSNTPVGSLLSGGLDSSSVTVMARELSEDELHTFSVVFSETKETDEREYIEAVLGTNEYQSHFIDGNDYTGYDYLEQLKRSCLHHHRPLLGTNLVLGRVHEKISDLGINVVLDGHGGDEVLSHGYGYRIQLAREGKWRNLIHDLRRGQKTKTAYWQGDFLLYLLYHGPFPYRLGKKLARLVSPLLQAHGGDRSNTLPTSSKLVRNVAIESRRKQHKKNRAAHTERDDHFSKLSESIQPEALEELNHKASAHSVETRLPFWDRRLIDFCLAVPSSRKRKDGTGRQIARAGLSNMLPRKVLTRKDKTRFSDSLAHALAASSSDPLRDVEEMRDELSSYIDLENLLPVMRRFLEEPRVSQKSDLFTTLETLKLAYFLLYEKKSPPDTPIQC